MLKITKTRRISGNALHRTLVYKHAICECGQEIVLEGDTECEHCNRWYNCWGQSIINPYAASYPTEDTGEYFSDIYIS